MANIENLKPFVKGDKRINRKGRIDNFAKFRKLAQNIGNEPLSDADEILFSGLLRALAKSKSSADRALFLAYAIGKPKEEVDVTSGGKAITKIVVEWQDDDNSDDKTPATP